MNIYDILQSSPMVHAIGITLIHFLWQGLLVALLLAGVLAYLKRSSPQVRYVAACIALLVMAVLPVVTFLHVYDSSPRVPAVVLPLPTAPEIESIAAERVIPPEPFEGPLPSDSEKLASARTLREQTAALCDKLAPWVTSLWLVGVVFLSSHLVGGLYMASMLRRRYASLLGERWQQTLDRLRETLGIRRAVALLQSHRIRVPTTMGWIRPAVLLPVSALTGLTPSQIEVLLVHELAHIRRYDYIVSLLQNIVETVLFYHPAVWWVSKQIRNERELCCDDTVLEVCGDAHAYAGALADMLTLRMHAPVAALAASGGSLSSRIRRMLGIPQPRANQSSRGLSAALVLAMLVTLCATVAAGLIGAGEIAAKKAYAKELLETVRAHNRAGEAHELGAEYEQAIGTYRNARQALEKLVNEFPEVGDYRKQLAENYIYMSRSHWYLGRYEEAEQACRRAIDLSEKLVTEFGEDPAYRGVLAHSYYGLGTVLWRTDRFDEAEQAHRIALAMREELVREFPDVPTYKGDLASSHNNLGLVLEDKGELDGAEEAHRSALDVYEELAWDFPNVPEYMEGLSKSHWNLGRVLLHKGEPDAAEQASRSGLAIGEGLTGEFPNVPGYRDRLAGSHSNLGVVLLYKGELDEAEQVYRSALVIQEELAGEFPNVPGYRDRLAGSHSNLGLVLKGQGELDEAEQAHRTALVIQEELAGEFPNVPEYRHGLAGNHSNLGLVLKGKGELDGAEQACRSAVAICEDLAREFPNVPEYRDRLGRTRFNLGIVLESQGEPDEAEQAYRTALAVYEDLRREFPQAPAHYHELLTDMLWGINNLAWRIATSPDVNLRDAASAVELAKKAVRGAPENASFWNTLGVAHYRAGQWEDTITASGKSRELDAGGHEGIDLFFMAMAHWQLGKEEEARRWYDRAVEWMEQYEGGTNEGDNRRFRAEAAKLLGISEPTGGKEMTLRKNDWIAHASVAA